MLYLIFLSYFIIFTTNIFYVNFLINILKTLDRKILEKKMNVEWRIMSNEWREPTGLKKRDALRECHNLSLFLTRAHTHEGYARKPIHICHQNASGFRTRAQQLSQ